MTNMQTIPVVDLKAMKNGTTADRAHFISTVGDALKDIGFFAVENHGVSTALIDKAYAVSQSFFEQEDQAKRKYEDLQLKGQRGFTSFGREHAKDAKAPDLKEFWHVGRELSPGSALNKVYPANLWPLEISEFKTTLQELFQQLESCAMTLLEACAIYLNEKPDLFKNVATDGNSILRIIHYPPISAESNPASIRASAHEDINLITLLCEATADGLELKKRDGTWLPIKAKRGQIVVDTGDMIQNMTNGVLKSTTHRVTNPDNSRERRFSMPFFVHPRSEVSLNPLESCVRIQGGKKLFPDITAGEYLSNRLKEIGLG